MFAGLLATAIAVGWMVRFGFFAFFDTDDLPLFLWQHAGAYVWLGSMVLMTIAGCLLGFRQPQQLGGPMKSYPEMCETAADVPADENTRLG